jgi:ankyrin repeat protein
MNEQNDKQADKRISSFLSSVDSSATPPDKQSLNKLQEQSTAEFLAATTHKNVQSEKTGTTSLWQIVTKGRIIKLAAAAVIAIAGFSAGHFSTEKKTGDVLKGKSLFAKRLFDDIAQSNDYMVKLQPDYEDLNLAMMYTQTPWYTRFAGEQYSEMFRKCQLLQLWEEGTSDEILNIYSAQNIGLVSDALFEVQWIEGHVIRAKFSGIDSEHLKKEMLDIETGNRLQVEGYFTDWQVAEVIDGKWHEDVNVIDNLFVHGDAYTQWARQLAVGTEVILAIRRIGYELFLLAAIDHTGESDAQAKLDKDQEQIREVADIVRLGREWMEAQAGPIIGIERAHESDVPLHRAIQKNDVDQVRKLIEEGADVNAKDSSDRIPLGYAAEKGNMEIVELLISSGADVNGKGHDDQVPFVWASEVGHLDIAKLLILEGTDANARDNGGSTCLIWAAWKGRTELIQILLDAGADINAKDDASVTALHDAVRGGHKETVELLITEGADVNIFSTRGGGTPLEIAIHNGGEEIAELLRKAGAIEPEAVDE